MSLEKDIAEALAEVFAVRKVGTYEDKEGSGDLYYYDFGDTFYREKEYQYLVEIPEWEMPANLLLHKLYYFERTGDKNEE